MQYLYECCSMVNSKTEKSKNYYSSREAAQLLGVAVSTVQLWTDNGILRAWTTAGGHRRIECESVDELISQQPFTSSSKKIEQALSVVIVEDDVQQIRLYERQFEIWKIDTNISTAKNGFEALIKIGHCVPDVVITDLLMPELDGFKMIQALKESPELSQCLIIVISGLDDDEIKKRGDLPTGVHLFSKPVSFEKLELLLHKKIKVKDI